MLEFGEKIPGVQYKDRIGAYAIIRNEKGLFALADVEGLYFLPGGALEHGESPEEAAIREALEEIGASISVTRKIGEASEYLYQESNNTYFRKIQTFFEAKIERIVGNGIEPDHKLAWVTLQEAKIHMRQASHIWAIEQLALKVQK
jgi:8-oxo-dGTP diphosphatase